MNIFLVEYNDFGLVYVVTSDMETAVRLFRDEYNSDNFNIKQIKSVSVSVCARVIVDRNKL